MFFEKKFVFFFLYIKFHKLQYDLNLQRVFLRRCKQEGIDLENLYKTAIVTIMSRQVKIVDYADSKTKHKFEVEISQ